MGERLDQVCSWARHVLSMVPLFGRLGEVPAEARADAVYETLITTLFATMPFWVLPVIGHFLFTPSPAFDDAIRKGEGLVYASALLGPLVFIITKRYGRFNLRFKQGQMAQSPLSMSFPYGGAFVTLTALTCAVAGFAFAITQRIELNSSGINHDGIRALSWFLMISSTLIFFLVTAYSNMLDTIEKNKAEMVVEEQPRQENDFTETWMESKT